MFISRHTLKWTKTCRSSGDFPHAHTAHFLLNRHMRHGREHAGAAVAGVGAGDLMGRVPRRRGWSYSPQRPWHAVHRHGVRHQGYGIWDAAVDRHRRRLVRQRHGRKRRRRVQDRAGMAAQTLRGSEGPGIGDVPVGLVAGTRSGSTSPWATGHSKRWKPSIMQTKRHKPPHYKGGTKIRPLHIDLVTGCWAD